MRETKVFQLSKFLRSLIGRGFSARLFRREIEPRTGFRKPRSHRETEREKKRELVVRIGEKENSINSREKEEARSKQVFMEN